MYMFTWRSPVTRGSVHGNELNFCFNTLNLSKRELPVISEKDKKFADLMSDVWAKFAHSGNPNISGLPEWPSYTSNNGATMILDYECVLKNNYDRKLADIINKHCFRQLDEFNNKRK